MLAWVAAIVIMSFALACARVSAKAQVTEPFNRQEAQGNAGLSILFALLGIAVARYL